MPPAARDHDPDDTAGARITATCVDEAVGKGPPSRRTTTTAVLSPITSTAGQHATLRLESERILVGRDPSAELSLNDDNVSRRHAQILHLGNDWTIEDLGSTNGTFVDGLPVVSCRLRNGDRIQIGSHQFAFHRLQKLEDDGVSAS